MNNQQSIKHPADQSTNIRKRKQGFSTDANNSSFTNCGIDTKRRPQHYIDQNGPNHLETCLVTERVSHYLRPVFEEATETLQKYITLHSRNN